MKTKSILSYLVPVIISGVLVSCSSSNKVASNFGKRHYTKGFFFDRPGKPSTPAVNTTTASLPKSKATVAATEIKVQNPVVTSQAPVASENQISVNTAKVSTDSKKSSFAKKMNAAFNSALTTVVAPKTASNSSSLSKVQSTESNSVANSGNVGGGGGGNCKSWIAALLLAFFLGGLGIHRFYLGYTWQGVVQLLTGGGCGIWAFIDFIRIIIKSLKPKNGDYCD